MSNNKEDKNRAELDELSQKYRQGDATIDDLLELGFLHYENHDKDLAAALFREILGVDPDNEYAKVLLGDCLLMHQGIHNRVQLLKKLAKDIIEEGGELSAAGYSILTSLYAEETAPSAFDPQVVMKLWEKAVSLRPSWPYLRYMLALAYERNGRFEEALRESNRSLEGHVRAIPSWPSYRIYVEGCITGRSPEENILRGMKNLNKKLRNLVKCE